MLLIYMRFKEGREDVNADAPSGFLSMLTLDENNEAVKTLDNRRLTNREVADNVDISFGSCQAIFTNVLCKKRAAAKIVPKLQNFEQKQHWMDIAQEMLATFNEDSDLLKRVITGDESLVYGYEIRT